MLIPEDVLISNEFIGQNCTKREIIRIVNK